MDMLEGEIGLGDLFNESNSIEMENENFVIVEDDGKMIIPNKQLIPFEELHCAEYDKFLVPIIIWNIYSWCRLG